MVNLSIPVPLSILLLLTHLAPCAAENLAYTGPSLNWSASLADGELCQAASDRPLLILVRADDAEDSLTREREIIDWMGGDGLDPYFCLVRLPMQAFGATAASIGIRSAPALVLVRNEIGLPVEMRVLETIQEPFTREEVERFIDRASMGKWRTRSDQATYYVDPDADPEALFNAGNRLHHEGDRASALEVLLAASRTVTDSSPGLRAKILASFAAVAYEVGELGKALSAYQEALKDSNWPNDARSSLLYQTALLLNDGGMNDAAARAIIESISLEADLNQREKKQETADAIRASLFVLAGMGYPGVVGYGGSPAGKDVREDLGAPGLTHADRVEKTKSDLDQIADRLAAYSREHGRFPDHLGQLPIGEPPISAQDPFFDRSEYRYLRYEDPEEAVLYSIGPDGVDQLGEEVYDPADGPEGMGDIVRRIQPEAFAPDEP